MNKHFRNGIWAFALAVLVTGFSKTNALYSFDETPQTKAQITVSTPPSRITINQLISLTINCEWEGDENQFRFILPPDFKLLNLRYLQMGQSSERQGGKQIKRFTFEFQPLKTGAARIDAFPFTYLPASNREMSFSHSVDAVNIEIIPTPFSWSAPLLTSLGSISLIAIIFLLFFIAKRHKKPIQSTEKLSLEAELLALLDKINLQANELHTNPENVLGDIEQILENYKTQKWGNRKAESLHKYDLDDIKEIERLLRLIETYQFGGLTINHSKLHDILTETRSLIAKHHIYEPTE